MINQFKKISDKIYNKGSFSKSVVIGIRFCVALPILIVLACMFFDALPDWGDYTSNGVRLWALLVIAMFEMVQWIVFDRFTIMKGLGIGVLALLMFVVFYNNRDVQTAFEIQKCKGDSDRYDKPFCVDYFNKQYELYAPYHYAYEGAEKKEE